MGRHTKCHRIKLSDDPNKDLGIRFRTVPSLLNVWAFNWSGGAILSKASSPKSIHTPALLYITRTHHNLDLAPFEYFRSTLA